MDCVGSYSERRFPPPLRFDSSKGITTLRRPNHLISLFQLVQTVTVYFEKEPVFKREMFSGARMKQTLVYINVQPSYLYIDMESIRK